MTTNKLPVLALVAGDPAGVGPEITARLLARSDWESKARVVVFADPAVLEAGARVAKVALSPLSCPSMKALAFEAGRPTLVSPGAKGKEAILPGQASRAGGRAALAALDAAVEAARRGAVQGIVFAPLNKQALKLAGLKHEDELRHMQERFAVEGFVCEFNVTGELWTSRVTSHIPLAEVAAAISQAGVCSAIAILDRALRSAGIARPRIGVAALNPHAGDGGNCGREEIEVIAPAIERMRMQGVEASGPFPADTVFVAARGGKFDAIVSMYHDQGQIAMKLMGFERGVTLHGGLPVPVTTCASGTAFDIAGKGIARHEGLEQAFSLAARIAGQALRAG